MARGLRKTQADELRRLYHQSREPLKVLAARLGVAVDTLRAHIRDEGWPSRRALRTQRPAHRDQDPSSRQSTKANCVGLAACTERPKLVGRIWAAALAQIDELEKRTKAIATKGSKSPIRSSDDARAIAILVRTLKDLMTLDATIDGDAREKTKDRSEPASPGGWNGLAEVLARRLAGLRKRRIAAGSAFGDGGSHA